MKNMQSHREESQLSDSLFDWMKTGRGTCPFFLASFQINAHINYMAIDYEPFGVYVVIESEGKIIVEDNNGKISLPFSYGENKENPQKCAKRIIGTVTSTSPIFVKSLSFVERKAIETIPSDIKKKWPKGAMTIPVYAFSYTLSALSDNLTLSYIFINKETVMTKVSEMEKEVLDCE